MRTWNFLFASTSNVSKGLYTFQSLAPGSFTMSLPVVTSMISFVEVPNSYSPLAIAPTVAGPSVVLNAMDFTFPSKYSFTLSTLPSFFL